VRFPEVGGPVDCYRSGKNSPKVTQSPDTPVSWLPCALNGPLSWGAGQLYSASLSPFCTAWRGSREAPADRLTRIRGHPSETWSFTAQVSPAQLGTKPSVVVAGVGGACERGCASEQLAANGFPADGFRLKTSTVTSKLVAVRTAEWCARGCGGASGWPTGGGRRPKSLCSTLYILYIGILRNLFFSHQFSNRLIPQGINSRVAARKKRVTPNFRRDESRWRISPLSTG